MDIVLGIVGAVLGGWLFNTLGMAGVTGFNQYSRQPAGGLIRLGQPRGGGITPLIAGLAQDWLRIQFGVACETEIPPSVLAWSAIPTRSPDGHLWTRNFWAH